MIDDSKCTDSSIFPILRNGFYIALIAAIVVEPEGLGRWNYDEINFLEAFISNELSGLH